MSKQTNNDGFPVGNKIWGAGQDSDPFTNLEADRGKKGFPFLPPVFQAQTG
jgi:hypothetical protein